MLAKAFATASGGLTKPAATQLRAHQREWLDFAQSACTDTAEPLVSGSYDEEGADCLARLFGRRTDVLEQSRMIGGHRFTVASRYEVLPDPDAAADPDYYWKVATHELSYPLLDEDDPLAGDFNAFIQAETADQASLNASSGGQEVALSNAQADTDNSLSITAVNKARITLQSDSYWFGHGAAHGNWGVSYIHYLIDQQRALQASDVFAGKGWETRLADLAFAQLQTEHSDALQVESAEDIKDVVTLPSRWSFENDYGLTIQFEPYEVSAYAYGAPTILVRWENLEGLTAEGLDTIRYGF